MTTPFKNRREAGARLSAALQKFSHSPDTIVLALPRGGVPVAFEVAHHLNLPLDLLTVRKLGFPGYEELALGAIASGGVLIINKESASRLQIPDVTIENIAAQERHELERQESLYRNHRPLPDLHARNVILIDDGIATGSTMRAAIQAVRQLGAKFVVVATPVAPPSIDEALRHDADEFIALSAPPEFTAVGQFYEDFSQTSDTEVSDLLEQSTHFGQSTPHPNNPNSH